MKKRIAVVIMVSMMLSLTSCGKTEYEHYTLKPNDYLMGEKGEQGPNGDGKTSKVQEPEGDGQLTIDDIQSMNGGKARYVFGNQGYLSFLNGYYSSKIVNNYEDAIATLTRVQNLLGLGAGSEFFAIGGSRDDDGYTYYTYQQRQGNFTVQYATLRVVVDPDGYACGLSCSFTPNLGIVTTEETITAQEANEIVRNAWLNTGFNPEIYPDFTSFAIVTFNDVAYNCYVVYTSNPYSDAYEFGLNYYAVYVTTDGRLLDSIPVAALKTDNLNADSFQADSYFEALEQSYLTITTTKCNGEEEELTVPVAYNPNTGLYYLADVERKIMVSDFTDFIYRGGVVGTVTSADGYTWEKNDLLAYDRYIKLYDFYASLGLKSPDGCGTPILVLTGYADSTGKPVDNAGNLGIIYGFCCFGVSDVNTLSEAVDVVGHEYTHGVTSYSMNGIKYENATGAINEAYSDIMGNISEMLTNSTEDMTWLVGENANTIFLRSMSNPHLYYQPVSLSDPYFVPYTDSPGSENDRGGVHTNNSLLSQLAYKLWAEGMTLEEECSLWITAIELMTPLSEYQEMYESLIMSVRINGIDSSWEEFIYEAMKEAELIE